jgi:hypothetical protein
MHISKQKVGSIESPYIRLAKNQSTTKHMVIEYIDTKFQRKCKISLIIHIIELRKCREPSHCLNYDLSHCIEKPEPYALRIEWNSLDGGHMKGFQNNQVSNILRGS